MAGVDLSEFQLPTNTPYGTFDFAIIRASHGFTEDKEWRAHVWCMGVVKRPIGFYHVLESGNVGGEAAYFRNLVSPFTYRRGAWLDIARGDLADTLIATITVDTFRSVFDTGIYVNGSALQAMPEYKRFERIWYASINEPPPGRWLMWQSGQNAGIDVDWAANIGGGIKKGWEDFSWPNL